MKNRIYWSKNVEKIFDWFNQKNKKIINDKVIVKKQKKKLLNRTWLTILSYRFKYFSCMMNYSSDLFLDRALNLLLDSGIKHIKYSDYDMEITFNNGKKGDFWNSNKWYAWLSEGHIEAYYFSNTRPRRMTMARLKYYIDEYKTCNKEKELTFEEKLDKYSLIEAKTYPDYGYE